MERSPDRAARGSDAEEEGPDISGPDGKGSDAPSEKICFPQQKLIKWTGFLLTSARTGRKAN